MFRLFFRISIEKFNFFCSEFLVMRKRCLANVVFRNLMNASSTIFHIFAVERVSSMVCGFLILQIRLLSKPMLRWNTGTVFWSDIGLVLSPLIVPISICIWYLFAVYFLLSVLGIALPFPLCWRSDDYFILYGFHGQFYGFWFGPRGVSKMICLLASKANLYCTLQFFQKRDGLSVIFFSEKHRFPMECVYYLAAPCRILLFLYFTIRFAAQRHTLKIGFQD